MVVSLFAQSNIRFNNYWAKTYTINPASINDQYLIELNMAARKQWVGFNGAPTTLFASATTFIDKLNTQFGLRATQDQIGYTSTTDLDFTYAYQMEFYWGWKVNMGFALSYQSLGYDITKVTFASAYDPIIYSRLVQDQNFNSDLGVEIVSPHWKFGLASENVFSLFLPINQLFTNTNFLYGMYRQRMNQNISLGCGITGIQYSNIYQAELNLTSYFRPVNETNGFEIGLFYRTWNEMGALFGVDISDNFKLSYSYDFNLSGISRSSTGSHEILLTYKINRPQVCRTCEY